MAVLGASSLQINSATLGSQSGSAPMFACRAWVNFNGTGTVAIRGNGNVSSITDNGTGDYTVNFSTAMADANYCVTSSGQRAAADADSGSMVSIRKDTALATGSVRVQAINPSATLRDHTIVCVAIFR